MGRRRWKQYQDTLYSGTRSSESATAQPHHRLYPALSSSCNPIPGSLDQIGPQLHHPVPSSLPSAIASTALTTATTTTATATTLATSVVKQESLQRHHLQNHHQHLQAPAHQDHHLQQQDLRRLRPGEIKVEAADEEPVDGVVREDVAIARTTDTATTSTTATTTGAATTMTTATASAITTASGTTTITTRRRRGRRQIDGEDVDGEEDGDENDDETGRGQNEAEKRLKLDVDADRSAASPLRTENDRANHPIANATDTEGTKVNDN